MFDSPPEAPGIQALQGRDARLSCARDMLYSSFKALYGLLYRSLFGFAIRRRRPPRCTVWVWSDRHQLNAP